MSSIRLTKSQAIDRMNQLANEAIELGNKQQKVIKDYNSLLQEHFGLVEDGKNMSKIEVINLINQVISIPRIR